MPPGNRKNTFLFLHYTQFRRFNSYEYCEKICQYSAERGKFLLQEDSDGGKLGAKFHTGGVAKRPKATVCKTVIRRFESGRRLLSFCGTEFNNHLKNSVSTKDSEIHTFEWVI